MSEGDSGAAKGDQPAAGGGPEAAGPVGIGGWLMLPALGLVLFPVQLVLGLVEAGSETDGPTWRSLWDFLQLGPLGWSQSLAADPWGWALLGFGIVGMALVLTLLVADLLCIWLMIRRSRHFPRLISALYVGAALLTGLILAMTFVFPGEFADRDRQDLGGALAAAVVSCAIWLPYFRLSRRVRNTFVR